MITQKQLEQIVMEEVSFVEERFMSSKFRKAIENYQDLQLKQQQLQKAFVGTKDPKKREKLKKALVKMHYAVKKAEAEFNSALHIEPVDYQEESVNEAKAVKLGNVKKEVSLITREYSMDFDDDDIYKFGKDINKLIGKGAGKTVEWAEFEKIALQANKRYKYSKDRMKMFMDDFKSNIFESITTKTTVNESTGIVEAKKFDIDKLYKGAKEFFPRGWESRSFKEKQLAVTLFKQSKVFQKNKKKYFKEEVATESTKAYGDSLKQIARDKQMKMLSKKDKETLLKIADLMKRANEGTIQATDDQMNTLKEKFNQVLEGSCGYGVDGKVSDEPAGPHLEEADAPKSGLQSKGINKNDIQVLALDYLKGTGVLHKISRKAYQTWLKGLKVSYNYTQARLEIMKLVKLGNLAPKISKSKHQKWMKDMLGEGKLTEAKVSKSKLTKELLNLKFMGAKPLSRYQVSEIIDLLYQHKLVEDKLTEAEMKVGHAEVRKLEKSLSSKNKELMVKAFDQGKIKTSKDLRNWVKSIGEGKLTEAKVSKSKLTKELLNLKFMGAKPLSRYQVSEIIDLLYQHKLVEGKLTEAPKLRRGLKPLLVLGSKITKKVGEDALMKLSDKFDRMEYPINMIASHLDMAIELMQDGYPADATKKLKDFNKACKDVLKGKDIKSAFEGVNEADLDSEDREYDKYSYHGDTLVAGITPAHNINRPGTIAMGEPKVKEFALVMIDMTNSVEKVLYVGDEKSFKKIVGKFAMDGTKKANMSSLLKYAAKSGYTNVGIPKAVYQKLKKNSSKLQKASPQVNQLKGMSEDKLIPKKKEKNEGNLAEGKTKAITGLKVGDKFIVNQEPAVLSAQRAYYKLSPKKFSDIVFQVVKVNPKSVAAIAIKNGDKLPWSASPATSPFVDKKGNTRSKEYPQGYEYGDAIEKGVAFKRYVFTKIPTLKGDGNIPVTMK